MEKHIAEVAKFIAQIGNRAIWRLIGNIILFAVGVAVLIIMRYEWQPDQHLFRLLLVLSTFATLGGLVGTIDVIPEVRRSTAAWKSFAAIVKALDKESPLPDGLPKR